MQRAEERRKPELGWLAGSRTDGGLKEMEAGQWDKGAQEAGGQVGDAEEALWC